MMGYALLTTFIIELALTFFSGASWGHTALYDVITNPSGITSSAFYVILIVLLTLSAAAAITPGFIYQTNQYALFAGAVVSLITYVTVFAHFSVFVAGQLYSMVGPEATMLITSLICAPLIILYLTAMIEWTRFNQ
jgi:hypothetical protein